MICASMKGYLSLQIAHKRAVLSAPVVRGRLISHALSSIARFPAHRMHLFAFAAGRLLFVCLCLRRFPLISPLAGAARAVAVAAAPPLY